MQNIQTRSASFFSSVSYAFSLATLFCASLALSTLGACGDDSDEESSSNTTAQTPADGTLVASARLSTALSTGEQLNDKENVATNPQDRADIGFIRSDYVGDRDISQDFVGQGGTYSFDIDEDGENEEIGVLVSAADGTVFLSWAEEDTCNLAWSEDSGASWLLIDTCGGSDKGVIVCDVDAGECQRCKGANCNACTIEESEIRCSSGGSFFGGGGGGGTSGTSGTSGSTTTEVQFGECTAECLEDEGGECCTTCGCSGPCTPVCPSGTSWDCEVGCCFDYDALECVE